MALESDLVEILPDIQRRQVGDGVEILRSSDGDQAEVFLDGAKPPQEFDNPGDEFDFNLAKKMSKGQRNHLAQKIVEFNTTDRTSRSEWLETLKAGMELLGVAKLPESKIPFDGASQVQHPLIAEAVVQFNAHAIEEYFPATGPVKAKIMGKSTPKIQSQSERVEDWMNYYLTEMDKGYYPDTDQLLFLLPIWGSIFRKGYIDPRTKRPRLRLVKCEDLIVPYDATSIEEAPRVGHEYMLNGATIRRGIRNGLYTEVDLPEITSATLESNPSRSISDMADQRVEVRHEDDKNYHMLEYHLDWQLPPGIDNLDNDDHELPYIVLVDKDNLEVLSVRRNWKEADPLRLKRNWFEHYRFFPGVGFYGWGFIHAIGALAMATSGGIRALLDSATFANLQGGFKTKEAGKLGGDARLQPGVWKATEVPGDDINKMFFSPPWKEPSPALAKLIELLAQEGRRFTSVSQSLIGEADNKAPVGTTLALIEQSLKLFTAIHKRMHVSARGEFKMLSEMFAEYGDIDEYPYRVDGEDKFIFREDFDDRVDVLPVSDPNIFSNLIRISLCQARLELMNTNPQLYTRKQWMQAHREMLAALKVPNLDDAAPHAGGPKYMDPVSENALAMTSNGIQAYPGQLHAAHIACHENFIQHLAARAENDPEIQLVVQALMAHNRAHEALAYREQMAAQLGIDLPPMDITGEENEDLPPDIERMLSQGLAQKLLPPPVNPEDQQATQDVMDENARKDALAQADIERKGVALTAEQTRKDVAAQAELRRREAAHQQNLRIASAESAAGIQRENVELSADLSIKRAEAQADNLRAQESHQLDQSLATDSHQREHARADDGHEREHAREDDSHMRENLRADDSHDQDESRAQDSHERGESRSDDAHERGESRAQEEHEHSTARDQEQHEMAVEHAAEDHERGIKFESESHKQNLAHADQDAKARAKAAKAKGDKK